MAEALENIQQQKNIITEEGLAETEKLKEMKRMKREMKRKKWVDWKTEENEETKAKRANFDPADRIKRKKSVILLGYSGADYYGMQRNPGMRTIEEELFKAMHKHKWVTDDTFEQAQIACFQRAARTDKGVSAARQVCSIKLPDTLDIKAINEDLPEEIRIFATERVTKGFNAKDQCNARTYTYTLPTIAFESNCHGEDLHRRYESYRISADPLEKIKMTLKKYEGTKNFHNFTSRKNFLDPSSKRFIMSFTCSEPFVSPQGIEFVTLKVKGQSFMLHQIRKMVGVAIAIVRGNTTEATLENAFSEERIDLPMAPGLGLVLDTVHYERYNERYGTDGIHKPLTWEEQEPEINKFIEKYIFTNIYKTEHRDKGMLEWLDTLSLHTYEPRVEDATATAAAAAATAGATNAVLNAKEEESDDNEE